MAIPIEHESAEELKKWGMGLEKLIERCGLCNTPTRYWHDATNTPVCEGCAATRNVSDLTRSNAGNKPPQVGHPDRQTHKEPPAFVDGKCPMRIEP